MAEVLVLVEHAGGEVKKVTAELLTAAARLGTPAAVWAGPGAEAARGRLAELGAAKVYVADSADFADYVVAPKAELLAQLVGLAAPAAVLIAGSAEGREVAGRLAVKAGLGVLADAVNVAAAPDGTAVVSHANFGGSVTAQARVKSGPPVITVRPNAVTPEPPAARPSWSRSRSPPPPPPGRPGWPRARPRPGRPGPACKRRRSWSPAGGAPGRPPGSR